MGTPPVGAMMGAMLTRGTQKRDRQAFDDELDRLRARVNISGSETVISAGGETVRENLPGVLALVVEAMRTPAFPPAELDKLKRETITELEASRSEPEALASRALSRHDNPYPRGDVRYAPTLEEEIADLGRLSIDDVRAFHTRFVGASDGEIAIVGDFDPAQVKKALEELFANWKSPSPFARVPTPYRPPTPASLRFDTPDKANAIIIGDLDIRLRDLDPDYPALLIADRILGGSTESRLSLRIREKEGLSYGVGSSLGAGQIDDRGRFGFYAIFPPRELPKVRAAFAEELARALKDGFTEQEVANAKRALLEERRNNRAQDGVIAGALAQQAYLGRTFAESARIDAALAGGRRRHGQRRAAQAPDARPHRLGVRRGLSEAVTALAGARDPGAGRRRPRAPGVSASMARHAPVPTARRVALHHRARGAARCRRGPRVLAHAGHRRRPARGRHAAVARPQRAGGSRDRRARHRRPLARRDGRREARRGTLPLAALGLRRADRRTGAAGGGRDRARRRALRAGPAPARARRGAQRGAGRQQQRLLPAATARTHRARRRRAARRGGAAPRPDAGRRDRAAGARADAAAVRARRGCVVAHRLHQLPAGPRRHRAPVRAVLHRRRLRDPVAADPPRDGERLAAARPRRDHRRAHAPLLAGALVPARVAGGPRRASARRLRRRLRRPAAIAAHAARRRVPRQDRRGRCLGHAPARPARHAHRQPAPGGGDPRHGDRQPEERALPRCPAHRSPRGSCCWACSRRCSPR